MSVILTAVRPGSGRVQFLASKYLLREQMNNLFLLPHVGHSQELSRLPTNTMAVKLCYITEM